MLFVTFQSMPVVRMHIGESEALEAAYEAAAVEVRGAVASLSPLVTQALALLDQPGQNPVYGPMPALTTAASGLGQDGDDVAWRIDLLRSFDSRPLDVDGRVLAFTPNDLPAAFRQAGLTPEEVEVAEDMMRNGVSFVHASQAAKSSNPEAALDRILLTEVEDRIANWAGTDNDPLLDQLVAELHEIEARMAERADELNDLWAAFRRQEAESWVATEWTPLETAERSLAEISDVLDTAKHDRGRGVGATVADGIWSTEDLEVVIANEHGYYTASQVAHAQTVLAMATSSPEARDHLGITQSGDGWTFSDIGHITLDVFGMVPVVGNAADGINAAWYAAEGEYLDAALSSIALIPGLGQLVTPARHSIRAAANGRVFRNLDDALAWVKAWIERMGLWRFGDDGTSAIAQGDNIPNPGGAVTRSDPDFAIGQIASAGDARASDLADWGASQGWVRSQTENGPIKLTDENGVVRLTIKRGSPRAPGSGSPHIEIRNVDGQRIDVYGNPVTRRSAGNHTPIVWDLES